ncbi:MAG: DNA polymerase III subunit delta [Pseudomonadota bacterium]
MKLQPKDISRAFASLRMDQRHILAYGPDAGGVRDTLKRAQAAIAGDDALDPMANISLSAEQLAADPARLLDEAAQPSFFGELKIISVGPVTDTHTKILVDLLGMTVPAYVLVAAGALAPRSKLRQAFEKAKNAYAVANYLDEERDIDALIEECLVGRGVSVSRDARLFLRRQLGNDRGVSRAEMEKLTLYAGAYAKQETPAQLELTDVQSLIGANAVQTTDDIAAATFSGQGERADQLLLGALGQNTTGVEITRALARRCLRLITASAAMTRGKTASEAIASLKPPVFWKDKNGFMAQLTAWQPDRLRVCLQRIVDAEVTLKSQGPQDDLILGRLIMQITSAGRRR